MSMTWIHNYLWNEHSISHVTFYTNTTINQHSSYKSSKTGRHCMHSVLLFDTEFFCQFFSHFFFYSFLCAKDCSFFLSVSHSLDLTWLFFRDRIKATQTTQHRNVSGNFLKEFDHTKINMQLGNNNMLASHRKFSSNYKMRWFLDKKKANERKKNEK